MISFLAQAQPLNFWNAPAGSGELWTKVGIALLLGLVFLAGLLAAPIQLRKPIVATFTFLSGLFYVLFYLWPAPIDRQPNELPVGPVEGVGFWLSDALPVVGNFTQVLAAFLIGLGLYSLLSVHGKKIVRQQKDWGFSAVFMVSMVAMLAVGFWDFNTRQGPNGAMLDNPANWQLPNFAKDLLFDGLLQQMDAAMFAIIAFFILSAAYRAFRIRSIEATILLATALLVMLSLMGAVSYALDGVIAGWSGGDPDAFITNFRLSEIRKWVGDAIQTPAIRGIDFGVGIGALAMGLRMWLSLDKTGGK
ncbi:MAG: hypothetical protein ACOYON_03715 [Fimbriimonas sp.]